MARLIETSLWIDFTRKKSPVGLKTLIHPWILDPSACICEAVAFEVLRHATVQERKWIEAQFSTLPLLETPAYLWRDSTALGQKCRANGFNAGSLDLVVAAIAIYHQTELVTFDSDYVAIAACSELEVKFLKREFRGD